MCGLLIAGILLAVLFYAKDLYDIWCTVAKSVLLEPSWSNHSLVTLGFVSASLCSIRSKYCKESDLRRVITILVILLLNTALDTIQDYIHYMLG